MNVLSLFDGMSCGQLALQRAEIKYDNYYASEIDKYSMKVAKTNFPSTIHLGSVVNIKAVDLPKIDLLIGGSPCQGFSFAGKQLNFDDPRSKLFFEYVRILKELKAENKDVKFLLENVKMKKEYQDVISKELGVQPIQINSALLSAQNRVRLYWTNIEGVTQPEDRGILLKDVLLGGVVDRDKSHCLDANYFKGSSPDNYLEKHRRQLVFADQESVDVVYAAASRGRNLVDNKRADIKGAETIQQLEVNESGKSNCLSTVTKDNFVLVLNDKVLEEIKSLELSDKAIEYMSRLRNGKPRWDFHKNDVEGKSSCLTANMYKGVPYGVVKSLVRKLHPIECERLQTVPDNYTSAVSNSQRYKMLGNGWTVEVISHIFKNLK